jgi:hypothetical protein
MIRGMNEDGRTSKISRVHDVWTGERRASLHEEPAESDKRTASPDHGQSQEAKSCIYARGCAGSCPPIIRSRYDGSMHFRGQ